MAGKKIRRSATTRGRSSRINTKGRSRKCRERAKRCFSGLVRVAIRRRKLLFNLGLILLGIIIGSWISLRFGEPTRVELEAGLEESTPEPVEARPNELYGIDISSNDEDFRAAIDKAQDFVILRATCNYRVDEIFDEAYSYAKTEGKLLGVYFWGNPVTCNPKEYASYCAGVSIAKGYIGEALIALDYEKKIGNEEEGYVDPTWALLWLDEFEKITGVRPIIYMNSNVAREENWDSAIFQGYQLWVADYGVDDGSNYGIPDGVADWTNLLTMHQYTTCGNGPQESLDMDVFYGDHLKWSGFAVVREDKSAA